MNTGYDKMLETAANLKSRLSEWRFGLELELLRYVTEYSFAPELKKRAIMAGLAYKHAQSQPSAADHPRSHELLSEMRAVIDAVYADYDEAEIARLGAEQFRTEIRLSNKYAQQAAAAFKGTALTKAFKSGFSLGPIDLEIRRGQVCAVVGENGNGKTTLFRIIAGEIAHDSGKLAYLSLGDPVRSNAYWRKIKSQIVYLPQELPAWWGDLKSNLQYEAAIHGIKGKDNDREVDYVIERLGLARHMRHRWNTLSGGYKLRFSLARALVWKPQMMILDEPLANLDVNAQIAMLNDIKSLATSIHHPIAVFISSQHIHEIEAIADNLLFLRNGKAVFNGKISELGQDRIENTFEVKAEQSIDDFAGLFPPEMPVSIRDVGMHYLVQTPVSVPKSEVLKAIIEGGINLEYFRDISNSSKKLFLDMAK